MLRIESFGTNDLPLIDRSAQKLLDSRWQVDSNLPLDVLIEQAGMAAANRLITEFNNGSIKSEISGRLLTGQPSVIVLGGKGNNGSDAWVCARHLAAAGWHVRCVFCGNDRSVMSENRQFNLLAKFGIDLFDFCELAEAAVPDIVIDGMLGTGYDSTRGLLPMIADAAGIIAGWRSAGSLVVSLDLPSGVDSDSGAVNRQAVRADLTITFSACKIGIAAAPGFVYAGRIVIEPIGMTRDWILKVLSESALPVLLDHNYVSKLKPDRPENAHKGTFGRALIVGGNQGMAGAMLLAGQAALRSGAGLITLAVSTAAYISLITSLPEVMTHEWSDDSSPDDMVELIAGKQAVAAGPGLASPRWLDKFIACCIMDAESLVLDADALNAVSRQPEKYRQLLNKRVESGMNWPVLTPHPGEFRRLAPDLEELVRRNRQAAALKLAERMNSVVVLKGAATVVASPDHLCLINTTGNNGMAKGGSGDCLTGIITGLLAQGLNPPAAAAAGVYLHGLAGDLAAETIGRTALLPRDLLNCLGKAWQKTGWLNYN